MASRRKKGANALGDALAEFGRVNSIDAGGWTPGVAGRLRGWLLDHVAGKAAETKAVVAVLRLNLVRELTRGP